MSFADVRSYIEAGPWYNDGTEVGSAYMEWNGPDYMFSIGCCGLHFAQLESANSSGHPQVNWEDYPNLWVAFIGLVVGQFAQIKVGEFTLTRQTNGMISIEADHRGRKFSVELAADAIRTQVIDEEFPAEAIDTIAAAMSVTNFNHSGEVQCFRANSWVGLSEEEVYGESDPEIETRPGCGVREFFLSMIENLSYEDLSCGPASMEIDEESFIVSTPGNAHEVFEVELDGDFDTDGNFARLWLLSRGKILSTNFQSCIPEDGVVLTSRNGSATIDFMTSSGFIHEVDYTDVNEYIEEQYRDAVRRFKKVGTPTLDDIDEYCSNQLGIPLTAAFPTDVAPVHPSEIMEDVALNSLIQAANAGESPYVSMARNFLAEVLEVVERKNADYCADSVADPLENLRLSEKVGICTTKTAILSRLMDKIARIRNLGLDSDREAQVDEALRDTLMDVVGYILLFNYAVEEENGNV